MGIVIRLRSRLGSIRHARYNLLADCGSGRYGDWHVYRRSHHADYRLQLSFHDEQISRRRRHLFLREESIGLRPRLLELVVFDSRLHSYHLGERDCFADYLPQIFGRRISIRLPLSSCGLRRLFWRDDVKSRCTVDFRRGVHARRKIGGLGSNCRGGDFIRRRADLYGGHFHERRKSLRFDAGLSFRKHEFIRGDLRNCRAGSVGIRRL